jgi:rhodanese-related sulfurtransferase
VLIAASEEQLSEARIRLARVGIDDARGYLKDGIEGWTMEGLELAEVPQISPPILNHRFLNNRAQLLDVRRRPEWEAGHIEGAAWLALDDFQGSVTGLDLPKLNLPELDRNQPIAILCKGGYRSLIAASLLLRAGFQNVINVTGGFRAWEKAGLPVVSESLAGV